MRNESAPDILATYRALDRIKRTKYLPILRHLPVEVVARRLFPGLFHIARYRNIRYENGAWIEAALAFAS
jgi:hypothetical protein